MQKSADSFLRALFQASVDRADPRGVLAGALPQQPATGRVIVLGAGKAAASMAAALEAAWSRPLEGLVVTRYGHGLPLKQIELVEAHRKKYQENNLPNLGSVFATRDIYSEIARNNLYFATIKKLVFFLSKFLGKRRDVFFANSMVKITKLILIKA